jgi:hypothetical protein
MVIAVSNPEPYVYMMRAEDLISNLGASSPSIESVEVFSPRSRKVNQKVGGTLPKRWSSSKSQRRLVTAITSPRLSVDESSSISSIKRGLSTKLRSFGGSPRPHNAAVKDLVGEKGEKPRRTRSVRGLLPSMFSKKIEEIVLPLDTKGANTKRLPDVRGLSVAGNLTHSYRPAQVKRPPLPKKIRTMGMPLEPISEVSSFVGLDLDSVPESEYALLQSTRHSLTTKFRHGHIRLPKSDLLPEGKPDVTVGQDIPECPEYDIALYRTAHHWLSSNYETLQEEEVDEIEDLIEWWESWGIEDIGALITGQEDEPLSPMSTTSDDFPGVSYSDTTSEGSFCSYPSWTNRPVSAAEEHFPKCSYAYELEDITRDPVDVLSGGDDSGLGLRVVGEPAGAGISKVSLMRYTAVIASQA